MRLVFFWPSPGAFAEPTWRFSNPTGLLHVVSTAACEHTALDPLPGLCNTIFPVVGLQIVLPHIPACRPLSSAAKSVSCGPSTTNAKVACSAGCENPASLSPVGAEGYFPILPMASRLFPLCSVSPSPPRPPQILTTALPPLACLHDRQLTKQGPAEPRSWFHTPLLLLWEGNIPVLLFFRLPPCSFSVLGLLLSVKFRGLAFSSVPPFLACF